MRAPASGRGLHNVPAELTSFVGRRHELAQIKERLGASRLVTLTGPGGVGKTRLALRAAAEMVRAFPQGAWLIELGPISDPLLVTQAVFQALGLQDTSAGWSVSKLTDYLAEKQALLVLDNCEHLLDSCAVLASSLLKACPRLRLLATSRQALAVPGESRFPVAPLSLPLEGAPIRAAELGTYDAAILLADRAAAVVPGFRIDDDNAAEIIGLCRRLDGIPLALELAAVRLEGLSIAQVMKGLDEELPMLASGTRGAEARQQTLDAAIGWSYGLLDPVDQRLWARLSVFAGGFDQEAAAVVCGASDLPANEVVMHLASLVEKSIVQRDPDQRPARYRMLETVRQFGRQRLRDRGEETELSRRHRDWVLELSRRVGAHDDREPQLFDQVAREIDNIWTAVEFCRREVGEAPAGAEICAQLYPYWYSCGPLSDVRRILVELYAKAPPNSIGRGWCDFTASALAALQNDREVAISTSQEALRIGRESRDGELFAWGAGAALLTALYVEARTDETLVALIDTLIEYGRAADRWYLEAVGFGYLCRLRLSQGNLEAAALAGETAVRMCRERNELFIRGAVLNNYVEVKRRLGQLEDAESLAREGAAGQHALGSRRGLGQLVETLAWMAADRGAYARAATLLGYAARTRESIVLALLPLHRPRHDASEQAARRELGDDAFAAAFERGATMADPEAIAYVLEQAPAIRSEATKPSATAKSAVQLTRREQGIAALVAEGLTNKEIASRLVISERTVESHVWNILNKLGFNSRSQVATWVGQQAAPTVMKA